jgi:DNA-directed RNA polymerase II subunit RPB11
LQKIWFHVLAADRHDAEGMACRVTYQRDTKIANAATFVIQREDHTVGDPLVMQLHEDLDVAFAAYKIPHPLEYLLLVKVRTNQRSSPEKAYNEAIECLKYEIKSMREQFQDRVVEMCGQADFAPHEKFVQQAPVVDFNMDQPGGQDYGQSMYGAPYGIDQSGGELAFEGAG